MLSLKSLSFLLVIFAAILLVQTPLVVAQGIPGPPSNGHNRPGVDANSGSISGSVYLADQKQANSEVLVTIQSTVNGWSRSVLTDGTGHFEFDDVPGGSYVVSASQIGYTAASTGTFVNGFHTDVTLNLNPVNSSSGTSTAPSVSVRQLQIPQKARELLQKGVQHIQNHEDARSVPLFQKAIAKYPEYYEAYYYLALAQVHLGQMDSAVQSLQSSIDLSKGRYSDAEFAYAAILVDRGNIADADRLATDGLAKEQNAPEGLLVMALIRLNENRLDEAEKNARAALARNGNFANAYLVLAEVHSSKRDFQAEIKDLDAYLRLQPNSPNAQTYRAQRATARQLANQQAATQPQR